MDKLIAENLAQDMADLMHDFDVVSRYDSADFMVHVEKSADSSLHEVSY